MKMWGFLAVVIAIICGVGYASYQVTKVSWEKQGKTLTPTAFVMGENPSGEAFGVGAAAGFVFGLIDNGGLFYGMKYMEPLFSLIPRNNEPLMNAGSVFLAVTDIPTHMLSMQIRKHLQ